MLCICLYNVYITIFFSGETSESEGVKQIISKLPTKFNHNALEEDGSASSEESDIDVFSPIPDALDNVFDD